MKDKEKRCCKHWYDYCEDSYGEICRVVKRSTGCMGQKDQCEHPGSWQPSEGTKWLIDIGEVAKADKGGV